MKICVGGDQHITNRKPKNRTDSYFDTVLNKFNQELSIAEEEHCTIVILPGDVFDSFKENHLVVQSIIYAIKEYPKIQVYVVAGQHDQLYHSTDLSGTPLETLIAAGVVTMLSDIPLLEDKGKISIYGSSWGEEIPEIISHKNLNILVIHRMIVDDKLWESQEDFTYANHLLLKTKYDLIISGDNHKQFTVHKGDRWLINAGAMIRSNISQLNHHPAVFIYDTETKKVDIIDLDCKPFQDVMKVSEIEKEKEKNEKLISFVHSLKEEHPGMEKDNKTYNFVERLQIKMETLDEGVNDILRDCLEGL